MIKVFNINSATKEDSNLVFRQSNGRDIQEEHNLSDVFQLNHLLCFISNTLKNPKVGNHFYIAKQFVFSFIRIFLL